MRPSREFLAIAAGLALACASGTAGAAAAEDTQSCARGGTFGNDEFHPKPAFAAQTNAPVIESRVKLAITVLAGSLEHPWSLAFLPDGRMLITERVGRLRILDRDGKLSPPLAGMPAVKTVGAEGLTGIAVDRDFASNRTLYFVYLAPLEDGRLTATFDEYQQWAGLPAEQHASHALGHRRVAKARLSVDGTRLENVQTLLEGGNRRIVQRKDGTLLVTADTPAPLTRDFADDAQRLTNMYGKVLRINSDGSVPADNPWHDKPEPTRFLFSYGHKDPEGAAINPGTGQLWLLEHGPRGGDEINIVLPGRNYGFPLVSYGRNYTGHLLNGGLTQKAGTEQPRYFWTPAIAPSGMMFYTGDLFPQWKGSLFMGALSAKSLIRLKLSGDRVVGEERFPLDRCSRIRDVGQGPDGAIYVLTDEDPGEVLRIRPAG